MSRPKKQTVDYFPHYCQHKKTMYILEQRYGNNGYAFWFKLLELLGDTQGHYLNLNDEAQWEFLQARTHLSGSLCLEILDLLVKLDAIDAELWAQKVVWCQNFVNGIAGVYKNMREDPPAKPALNSFPDQKSQKAKVSTDRNPPEAGVSTAENPQSKVKESIVNKSTLEKNIVCLAEPKTHDTDNDQVPEQSFRQPPVSLPELSFVNGVIPGQPARDNYPAEFEAFWQGYPKARRKEKRAAYRAWQLRLKQGTAQGLTADKLIAAARHYTAEMEAKGRETQYIKLPKTFLGPDSPFEDYIDPPEEKGLDPPKGWRILKKYINLEEVSNHDQG